MGKSEREPEQRYDRDWKAWRRSRRRELIARRQALDPADRRERSAAIDRWLELGFGAVAGHDVGLCWPFAAEPEPRFAVRRSRERGSRAALPVVLAPARHRSSANGGRVHQWNPASTTFPVPSAPR